MTVHDVTIAKIRKLPEPLALEVSDFVDFLLMKRDSTRWQLWISFSEAKDLADPKAIGMHQTSTMLINYNAVGALTYLQITENRAAVIEGDEDVLEEFKTFSSNVKPDEAEVDSVSFEDYRNTVPPIERCMQAFQMEQWGKGIPILSKMLEKQDITIDVLKSVKEDTSQIRQDTSQIPRIAENTSP